MQKGATTKKKNKQTHTNEGENMQNVSASRARNMCRNCELCARTASCAIGLAAVGNISKQINK